MTLANIIFLNMDVSLMSIGFYILLLIMISSMFHTSLVFKSCTYYVLVQFLYQLSFITLCCIPEVSSLVLVLQELFPVLKLGQQKGWAAQRTHTLRL